MMPGEHDLHTLAGAYVLDAVSDSERSSFETHLADCAGCRAEIAEFREVTTRIGAALALQPRPELRSQTIRAASLISQDGPVIPDGAVARRDSGSAEPSQHGRSGVPRRRAGHVSLLKLALAAAVVVIAGAVGLAGILRGTGESRKDMITSVFRAPDAVLLTAKISTGGMATAVISHREHMGVFMAHDLPVLPAAERYELWLMGPRGDRPAGMLSIRPSGMAGPELVRRIAPGDMIGLTIEPAAGSAHPTSATLVLIGPESAP